MNHGAVRQLWNLLSRQHQVRAIFLCLMIVFSGVLEFCSIAVLPGFVVALSRTSEIMAYPVIRPILDYLNIHDPITFIYASGIAIILIFIVRGLFSLVVLRYKATLMAAIALSLSLRLFMGYLRAPYSLHLVRNTAHFNHIVMQETERLVNGFLQPLLTLALNVVLILALLPILQLVDPLVALTVACIAGGACYLFTSASRKRLQHHGKEVGQRNQSLYQTLSEGLGSFKHIRLRGLEADIYREFNSHADRRERSMARLRFNQDLPKPLFQVVGVIALIGLALGMLLQGRSPDMIVPMLALLGTVTVRMLPILDNLTSNLSALRANTAAVHAVANEFRTLGLHEQQATASVGLDDPPPATMPVGDIVFEGVTFRYPGQHHDALHQLNLTIPVGRSVALVGPTGSGKTTAVDAMLGFLSLDRGRITVGGIPITDNLPGWQRLIGYIPQTIFLVDGSIRRNVALGVPEADIDEEMLWAALHDAQLSDFVDGLPDGLDTHIGERGVRLSGGQRQRIGIARALYQCPEVLVLDEATAALDNATESKLMAAVEIAKHGRTLVMIAHRLSTVRNCDQIFFIKAGVVVASGTYEELVAQSAEFREMANVPA